MVTPVGTAFANATTYQYPGMETSSERQQYVRPIPVFQFPQVQVFLLGEISDDLIVIQPIQVNIEQDDDNSYVVSDDIFLVYGDGRTKSEAVADYVASLIEFYDIAKEAAADSPLDRAQFAHLQAYIQPAQRGPNAVQADRD